MTKQEFEELFQVCRGIYEYHDKESNREFIKALICENAEVNGKELIRVLVRNMDEVSFGEVGAYLQAAFSYQRKHEERLELLFDGKTYGSERFPRREH